MIDNNTLKISHSLISLRKLGPLLKIFKKEKISPLHEYDYNVKKRQKKLTIEVYYWGIEKKTLLREKTK